MGTHLRVLSESFLMSTNPTKVQMFLRTFCISFLMDEISLSIGRVEREWGIWASSSANAEKAYVYNELSRFRMSS